MLNHLDVSGMNMDKKQIIEVCEIMQSCPNLMSVHLNDLGINLVDESSYFISQILHIFNLDDINIENATRTRSVVKELKNDHQIQEVLFHLKEQNKIIKPEELKLKRRQSLNPFE
tara:strand:+ start:347 stop:691 length:345 start_codon:yes stop_codon:yes gene_type:complete